MFRLILLRLAREWRVMTVLLVSMCLVTGFLALPPQYLQAVSISDLERRIDESTPFTFSVTVRNDVPFNDAVPQVIDDEVSIYASELRDYITTSGFTCGYDYIEDAETTSDSELESFFGDFTSRTECYRPYTYENFEQYFTVLDGRLPEPASTFADGERLYLEAILTQVTADDAGYTVGDFIIFGSDTSQSIVLEIVGIVETKLPVIAPFWSQQTFPDITLTPLDAAGTELRADVSFAITLQDFETHLFERYSDLTFVHQFEILPERIDYATVPLIEQALSDLRSELTLLHPDIGFSTRLLTLISDFNAGIASAQGPITVISFLVLIIMLYNMVTTVSLILEQQGEEWAMMASRGGSTWQLVYIQFVTVLLLTIIAALLGALVSYLIVIILAVVGPHASILDPTNLGAIPMRSVYLSVVASLIMLVLLTIPAWSFAGQSLQRLKSGLSRPPEQPVWARYFLDIIILMLGFVFLWRLLSFATDENPLSVLLNPSEFIAILSNTSSSILFADAFNLAGPVLILLGASMLWLRIFPYLIRLVATLFARGNGLTARLAFWNVERDSSHYAQLVLLLIGTLALGTASLALSQTRNVGALETALFDIGADATIDLDMATYDPTTDWQSLPTVTNAMPLLRLPTGSQETGGLIGVDLTALQSPSFDYLQEDLSALATSSETELVGIELPADTEVITVDVYAIEPAIEGIIDTQVQLVVQDLAGRSERIAMRNDNSTSFAEWLTYESDPINFGQAPYRITGLSLVSAHNTADEFEHTIYLDNMTAVSNTGTRTLVNSFEPDTTTLWRWTTSSQYQQLLPSMSLVSDDTIVSEGDHSLMVLHLLESANNDDGVRPAILEYTNTIFDDIPVVISQAFANIEGVSSRFNRPLQVDDSLTVAVSVAGSTLGDVVLNVPYTVVGIIDDFPTFESDAPLLIADIDLLRYRLNTLRSTSTVGRPFYDVNTIWFDLDTFQPSEDFVIAVSQNPDVIEAQFASSRFEELQRDPLANSVTGLLFAGFWISMVLSLMDFTFYMGMTLRRRALSFATLQALGWNERDLLRLLLVEQLAFISPALVIGVFFGILLAYVLLPFLNLVGILALQIPYLAIILLVTVLSVAFIIILRISAIYLRRLSLNDVMRFGE